jgi:glycosyltransferase involved in cell wall biosynthesis
LDKQIARSDPNRTYVEQTPFVSHQLIPTILGDAHAFVFASSCENMPVTLLEAMAVGLPIACSNRGPMPEILEGGGVYFDPEDFRSIASAIEQIIKNEHLRTNIARAAKARAESFSWKRCATETFKYLSTVARPPNGQDLCENAAS